MKNYNFFSFWKSIFLFLKHRFKITKIVWENDSVFSLYISGSNLDKLHIKAGQFMIFRFLVFGLWHRLYPLSVSLLPNQGEFRITIKQVGVFTKKMSCLPVGTRVLVFGPLGQIKSLSLISHKILLIAGGVAIAPARTLYQKFLQAGKDVILIYTSRQEGDFIFKSELDQLAFAYHSQIRYIPSAEVDHINIDKIKSLTPDFLEREIYLYGPLSMVESISLNLQQAGLPNQKINIEKF